ncbi:MAG: hypothetical protein JKX81_13290 [Arenicella sp.]|nr:hypothetical protein [Arenicella sp.]
MIKLLLPLVSSALMLMTFCANSQGLAANQNTSEAAVVEVIEQAKAAVPVAPEPIETDRSLWNQANANPTLDALSVYLAKFPNGEFAGQARLMFQDLEDKARAREKIDKQLEAYRKRQNPGGIVLELDGKFTDIKPYFRSMVNSCGYTLVQPHRFAKRVYPTLEIKGQMFNGVSDSEHAVTLDLALLLKTTTREIKARQKMSSYRTSKVDTHQALIAAFEDIGAQMKSAGFCIVD